MSFGQQSGPPASASQMKELSAFLREGGHTDFRDARRSMGFTQRQAGGRFTRDEAEAVLERLRNADPADAIAEVPDEPAVHHIQTDLLVAELRRRGWTVAKP